MVCWVLYTTIHVLLLYLNHVIFVRQTEEAGGGGGSSFGFFGFTKRVGQFVEDVATTLDDTIGHAFEEWQLDGSTRLGGGSARGGDECSAAAEDKEGLCATPENMGACRGAPEMSPVSSSECSSSVMEEWGDFSIDNEDEDEMASLWRRNKVVRRLEQQVRELGRENEELKASRIDEQTRHQIEKLVEEKSELKRENDRLVRENKSLSEMVAYLVATSPASCDSIDHSILLDGMVDHPPPILHHDGSSSV